MIIAQAMEDELTIVSKDSMFKNYGVDLIWDK